MENTRVKLSDYVQGLSEEAKSRYKQKISFIGGVDPFWMVSATAFLRLKAGLLLTRVTLCLTWC